MSTRKLFTRNVWVFLVMAALFLSSCGPAATPIATQPPAATTVATQPPAPTEAKAPLTPDRLVPEITFKFSTAEHDSVRNEIGLMLTKEWEKLGLRVIAQPLDYESQIAALRSGVGFNVFTFGFDGRPERLDPDVLLRRVFYSNPGNYMGYNNPVYDALVDAERSEMNIDKRQKLVFAAQEILANDLPAVALYHDSDIDAYNSARFDNVQLMPGAGTYNYWTLLYATPKTDQKYFKVGHNELPVNLNPFHEGSGASIEVMRELYDMLARVGLDGMPTPGAAESWKIVDPTTIEVTLRKGMKFNDGVPVTTKDVKFSYDVQKTQGASIYKMFLVNISSIDITDDYHMTFHLTAPDAPIFMATFAQIYIIPEHIWSKVPDPKVDYINDKPVGSGPFNLVYWRPDEELKADANKDYQFPPKNDGFYIVQYSNIDAVFQGLVIQEVDTNYDPLNAVQAEAARGLPYLTVTNKPSHQVRLVGFNVRIPPFDDPKFRDAIGYTIDFDAIVNVMLTGNGIAGAGIIAPDNTFWHNPNQNIRGYDIAKARELLAAAGYEWDAQGLMYMPATK